METAKKPQIHPGDSVRPFASACRERFHRSTRWGWYKVKNAAGFPRPIYIDGSPHLIDREIDEYLASCPTEKVAA